MMNLSAITFLVPDYDEAIAWFRDVLGFALLENVAMGEGKRWVVMRGNEGAKLVIAKAANLVQRTRIGDAAGGRVAYFLETSDFAGVHAAMLARGVNFLEAPRHESYGSVAVFQDPWGGRWDLLERREGRPS